MKYNLIITPAIKPEVRHAIQDVLTAYGFDVHGGGTRTDRTMCDISFSKKNLNKKGRRKHGNRQAAF